MNPLSAISRGLIRQFRESESKVEFPLHTKSLCPECLKVIEATIDSDDGRVFMYKSCSEHGDFRELLSTDGRFYRLMLERERCFQFRGVSNPVCTKQTECPRACGICNEHLNAPIMMNIDLTNRCNLNCPICFANSNASGVVVEPDLDTVRMMLDKACALDSIRPACFQYTGGEPTVYPAFLEALQEAKKRGFTQIQVATNGIRFSDEPELAFKAAEAGLNIAYLQFDGIDDEVYLKIRGRSLAETKFKAVDNFYKAGIRTVLVPTLVKGINDHQIGKIIQYSLDNIEKISGISWQPVAFTGRIDYQQRVAQRFTLTDLAREIAEQTGLVDMYRDWYPFSFADAFTKFLEAVTNDRQITMGCHPACGAATYLIVNLRTKESTALPEFVDVEPLMDRLAIVAGKLKKRRILHNVSIGNELRRFRRYYHQDKGPSGWSFETFVNFMMDFARFRQHYKDNEAKRKLLSNMPYRSLLMASMHFQDSYNYQTDRVQRCVIHYAAPDGRIYPFCSYNSGPCHRNRIEEQFAVSAAEYQSRKTSR